MSIESDFLKFLEFVPYHESNLDMYSPKLTGLLLQIGGYVDSAFKEIASYYTFTDMRICKRSGRSIEEKKKKKPIEDVLDACCILESIYNLSSNNNGELIAKLDFGDKRLYPFKSFATTESPDWWSDYNDVKHEYSLHFKKASITNVLEGLAGAFLLNTVHYPSMKLLWQLGHLSVGLEAARGFRDIFLSEKEFEGYMQNAILTLKPLNLGIRTETALFLYVHE